MIDENPVAGGKRILKVDQYSYIRTAHRVYGKTIKQIARDQATAKIRSSGLSEANMPDTGHDFTSHKGLPPIGFNEII
jgi:hypothetical protein